MDFFPPRCERGDWNFGFSAHMAGSLLVKRCFFCSIEENLLAMQTEKPVFNHILFSEVSFQKGDKFGKKYQWSKDSIDDRVKSAQAKMHILFP